MNRHCMGHMFEANGTTYYRCLYDGSICAPAPRNGEDCPLCGRRTVCVDRSPVSLVQIETEGMGSIKKINLLTAVLWKDDEDDKPHKTVVVTDAKYREVNGTMELVVDFEESDKRADEEEEEDNPETRCMVTLDNAIQAARDAKDQTLYDILKAVEICTDLGFGDRALEQLKRVSDPIREVLREKSPGAGCWLWLMSVKPGGAK